MKFPKPLNPGDTIGLVAPSSASSPERVEETIKKLEELGYRVKAADNLAESYHGLMAGPAQKRADWVNRMFADPEVDAIICIRGGDGSSRIMEYLDYDRLAALIARAKAASDFVIVFPHWGTEYFLGVDQKEQEEAGFLAAQGVDLVIGTHPHVVEPVSYVTRPDGGQMLIYYSLGNYQSIQNLEETMIGGMAQVEITKGYNGKARITDFNMEFLANDYRMSGRFLDYYDIVTTYPWELYSRDLAETSWVHHDNENFNVDKMFSIQAQMAAQVATERANAGMPRH